MEKSRNIKAPRWCSRWVGEGTTWRVRVLTGCCGDCQLCARMVECECQAARWSCRIVGVTDDSTCDGRGKGELSCLPPTFRLLTITLGPETTRSWGSPTWTGTSSERGRRAPSPDQRRRHAPAFGQRGIQSPQQGVFRIDRCAHCGGYSDRDVQHRDQSEWFEVYHRKAVPSQEWYGRFSFFRWFFEITMHRGPGYSIPRRTSMRRREHDAPAWALCRHVWHALLHHIPRYTPHY